VCVYESVCVCVCVCVFVCVCVCACVCMLSRQRAVPFMCRGIGCGLWGCVHLGLCLGREGGAAHAEFARRQSHTHTHTMVWVREPRESGILCLYVWGDAAGIAEVLEGSDR